MSSRPNTNSTSKSAMQSHQKLRLRDVSVHPHVNLLAFPCPLAYRDFGFCANHPFIDPGFARRCDFEGSECRADAAADRLAERRGFRVHSLRNEHVYRP